MCRVSLLCVPWALALCGFLLCGAAHGRPPTKEQLYLQAMGLYKSKKYTKASKLFHKALALFRKARQSQKKGSRLRHQYTLGESDILLRLAEVATQQGKARTACRLHQHIETLRKTLPPQWRQWVSLSTLPKRFDRSSQALTGTCSRVPSLVTILRQPSHAIVSQQAADGTWHPVRGKHLSTTQNEVKVKVSAKGFRSVEKSIKVAPWSTKTLTITLAPAPKRTKPRPTTRRIVRPPPPRRRLPPPPTPIYQTWWFWTITGVIVAGGTTAIVLAATAQTSVTLRGKGTNDDFKVW